MTNLQDIIALLTDLVTERDTALSDLSQCQGDRINMVSRIAELEQRISNEGVATLTAERDQYLAERNAAKAEITRLNAAIIAALNPPA